MAIIDNYISKNEVANLIGKDITVIDAHGNSIKEYKWAEMIHGTVCTSILAEKFKDANITGSFFMGLTYGNLFRRGMLSISVI